MYTAEYYFVEIVSALLGLSYPFIFQIITSIDEKYQSSSLVKLFKKEPTYKRFNRFFVILLLICVSMPCLVGKTGSDLEFRWWSPQGIAMAVILLALINSILLFIKIGHYYDPQELSNLIDKKLKRRAASLRNQLQLLRRRNEHLKEYSNYFTSHKWLISRQIVNLMANGIQRTDQRIAEILENEIPNDLTFTCLRGLLGFSVRENDVPLYLKLNDLFYWSIMQVQNGSQEE